MEKQNADNTQTCASTLQFNDIVICYRFTVQWVNHLFLDYLFHTFHCHYWLTKKFTKCLMRKKNQVKKLEKFRLSCWKLFIIWRIYRSSHTIANVVHKRLFIAWFNIRSSSQWSSRSKQFFFSHISVNSNLIYLHWVKIQNSRPASSPSEAKFKYVVDGDQSLKN